MMTMMTITRRWQFGTVSSNVSQKIKVCDLNIISKEKTRYLLTYM